MKPAVFRSLLFNVLFYGLTALICVLCLPLLLFPRRYFMRLVRFFVRKVHFLERFILGLDYEIRGWENIPKDGAFILAAKHQSAYETLKLHLIFDDPAVILKRELLSIPLWGMYLKKADPIAIDRSTPDAAITSIKEGAKRMKALGRPIVIFPQGTRVPVEQTAQDKPYKIGVARIQEATDLPIIPMALNAGLFWPKNSFFKSSGKVVFEFLPPIPPGLSKNEVLKTLEATTENATLSLINEARESIIDRKPPYVAILCSLLVLCSVLFGVYSYVWFAVAERIQIEYPRALAKLTDAESPVQIPTVSGYPGKVELFIQQEVVKTEDGIVEVQNLRAYGWPIPALPINIETGTLKIQNHKWRNPLVFDSLNAVLRYDGQMLHILDSQLVQSDFNANMTGAADLAQEPIPLFDLKVRLTNHHLLLQKLAADGLIETRMALFMTAGLGSLANEDGVVEVPVYQREQTLYAGPLPVLKLPPTQKPHNNVRRQTTIPSPSEQGLESPRDPSQ